MNVEHYLFLEWNLINLRLLLILCLVSVGYVANAQFGDKYWTKYSPEFKVSFTKSKIELRFRPVDYVSPFSKVRTDFMIGKVFKKERFKIFSYTKFDTKSRAWSGIRIETNNKIIKGKMLIHLQYRYFWGLNNNSLDQQYFVQVLNYSVSEKIKPGILGFYKKTKGEIPFWFLGPSADFKFTENISLLTAFCKDILDNYNYLIFLRLNFKFKIEQVEDK